MAKNYSDKPIDHNKAAREASMQEAIANFSGKVQVCKAYMPKKKRNPVGGK